MSDNASTPSAPVAEGQPAAEGQEAQPQGQAAPKPKAPQYRKFQIGGEEVALTDDDIKRDYQKWKGAEAKFREAAEAKQSVEKFMKALQEDPESVLADPRLPIDRKRLAEKWLVEQIEQELKVVDPRDQKLTEAERRLAEYERREAEAKQTKEQQARQAQVEQRRNALSNTLAEAMKDTPLAAHPETAAATLREMALYMRAAKERGENVTPQELVEHIHNGRFNQFYTLANQFEGDDLIEFLGEEVLNRIRKADLARLKASREQGQSWRADKSEAPARGSRPKRIDPATARDNARKMMK